MLAMIAVCALAETFTARDQDVVKAYLASVVERQKEPPTQFVIQPTTSGSLFKLCVERLDERAKKSPELAQTAKSIAARNTAPVRIDQLTWDSNVIFFDLTKQPELARSTGFRKRFGAAAAAFRFDLPGYSEDGKSAVVFAWLGPSHIHSVHELAMLTLKDGKWKVAWRELAYYL